LDSLGRRFAKRTPRPKAAEPDAGADFEPFAGEKDDSENETRDPFPESRESIKKK
jgi:hypothetical protein